MNSDFLIAFLEDVSVAYGISLLKLVILQVILFLTPKKGFNINKLLKQMNM